MQLACLSLVCMNLCSSRPECCTY